MTLAQRPFCLTRPRAPIDREMTKILWLEHIEALFRENPAAGDEAARAGLERSSRHSYRLHSHGIQRRRRTRSLPRNRTPPLHGRRCGSRSARRTEPSVITPLCRRHGSVRLARRAKRADRRFEFAVRTADSLRDASSSGQMSAQPSAHTQPHVEASIRAVRIALLRLALDDESVAIDAELIVGTRVRDLAGAAPRRSRSRRGC